MLLWMRPILKDLVAKGVKAMSNAREQKKKEHILAPHSTSHLVLSVLICIQINEF